MDELSRRRQAHLEQQSAQPLWREVLGARLRRLRRFRGLRLTDLAAMAGVSPQYLSEIERGRKEPSSEMIAAISGALGLTLVELTSHVSDELQRAQVSAFYPPAGGQPESLSSAGPAQSLLSGGSPQLSLVA